MEQEKKLKQDLKDLFLKHQEAMLDVAKTYSDLLNFLINNNLIDFD